MLLAERKQIEKITKIISNKDKEFSRTLKERERVETSLSFNGYRVEYTVQKLEGEIIYSMNSTMYGIFKKDSLLDEIYKKLVHRYIFKI